MIPAFLVARYGPQVAKLIVIAIAVLVVIALSVGGYFIAKNHFQGPLKTQVKVGAAQGQAQAASGTDAVNTVGNVMGNESAVDTVTRENNDAIDNAQGATVVVDPAVRAAGLQSLCRRASYRSSHPACLQHPAP